MQLPALLARTSLAAVLALSTFATLDAREDASARAGANAAVVDTGRIRIDNFGQISPTYYRGAQPEGPDYSALAALGVKTVINLTSHDALADEPDMVEQAGMKYVSLPMTTRTVPTSEELATFLAVVNDPAHQPVFVHCVGGKHRTGVMTAVYRMTQHSWTPDQAFKEMKQFKFGSDFLHPEFKRFVYGYQAPEAPAKAPVLAVALTEG